MRSARTFRTVGSKCADDLPSLTENDEYFVLCRQLALLGFALRPDNSPHRRCDLLGGVATDEDLSGLPPHVISVNELDPIRDEGLQYYRRFVHAGVPAVGRSSQARATAATLILPQVMPEVFDASVRDVSGFAKSVG